MRTANYHHAIGAKVAFVKKSGVAMGVIAAVTIRVEAGTCQGSGRFTQEFVRYELTVANHGNDRWGQRKTHIEHVKAEHVFDTLEGAWVAFETGVKGLDEDNG